MNGHGHGYGHGHGHGYGHPPRDQNPHLSDLPRILDGGRPAPPLVDTSRLDKLEEEAERLRRTIEDKTARKRRGVREWERLERESETAGFRAELAEEGLRGLGEDEGGFF